MGKINLLDCTLRDGGYVNNWEFGSDAIKGTIRKLVQTGIEYIEVGFLKGDKCDNDRSVFPDVESVKNVIGGKNALVKYVGMLDLSDPIPMERIIQCDGTALDGIRVIFKKSKMDEAFRYCKRIKEQGYLLFVNFVSTDQYTDKEFIEGIEKFNVLNPDGVTLVDTFGLFNRKNFLRLVSLADNNLKPEIMLCYHAHNNLQQAFGNAEALVEMNLKRDILIDGCVFGMGRGAGNLNLELFAGYLNENYGKHYQITPMLEIMDEYLEKFYHTKFWGYSLPLYLSASLGCHPNYAIYLAEKNTLSEKSYKELLESISTEDRIIFSKEKAELYYRKYFENYVDDKNSVRVLTEKFANKKVLLLAPGKTLGEYEKFIKEYISKESLIIVSVNFDGRQFGSQYVFCGNARRYKQLVNNIQAKLIITSNVKDGTADYIVNSVSYRARNEAIIDNAGIMALRFLQALGVQEIYIAGMDGFKDGVKGVNFFDERFESSYEDSNVHKNDLIAEEIREISRQVKIEFLTPTMYENAGEK